MSKKQKCWFCNEGSCASDFKFYDLLLVKGEWVAVEGKTYKEGEDIWNCDGVAEIAEKVLESNEVDKDLEYDLLYFHNEDLQENFGKYKNPNNLWPVSCGPYCTLCETRY